MKFYRTKTLALVGVILALVMALTGSVVYAQDFDLGLDDAVIAGDLSDPDWGVVNNFFVTRDFNTLGADFMWEGPFTTGAIADDDVVNGDTIFDREAFADAEYDINTVIVGDDAIAVEFIVNSTWTGPFMGFEPTGAFINVPAAAVFQFDDAGLVSNVRTYYDTNALRSQLGIAESDFMAVGEGIAEDDTLIGEGVAEDDELIGDEGIAEDEAFEDDFEIVDATLDEITDDPAAYMGMYVSVVGTVDDFVGGVFTNGLIIVEEDLIGDDPALVIGETPEVLALYDWELDTEVAVTGWVRGLNITELEAEFGYDLDDDLYVDYEGYPVIVAREVAPVLDE